MTPVEIFEYKQKWLPGYAVKIHSDLRRAAKDWCKQLDKTEWSHKEYTDVYQDTFYFEKIIVAQNFEVEFIDWIQKDI